MWTLAIYALSHTTKNMILENLDLYILLKNVLKMQEMPLQRLNIQNFPGGHTSGPSTNPPTNVSSLINADNITGKFPKYFLKSSKWLPYTPSPQLQRPRYVPASQFNWLVIWIFHNMLWVECAWNVVVERHAKLNIYGCSEQWNAFYNPYMQ